MIYHFLICLIYIIYLQCNMLYCYNKLYIICLTIYNCTPNTLDILHVTNSMSSFIQPYINYTQIIMSMYRKYEWNELKIYYLLSNRTSGIKASTWEPTIVSRYKLVLMGSLLMLQQVPFSNEPWPIHLASVGPKESYLLTEG